MCILHDTLARGKSRSGTIEQVRRQAEDAAANGVKEIVLTGVNIGDFGRREGVLPEDRETFLQLIQTLDELKGIERFRISSIEPNLLSDDIIRFVAGSKDLFRTFTFLCKAAATRS